MVDCSVIATASLARTPCVLVEPSHHVVQEPCGSKTLARRPRHYTVRRRQGEFAMSASSIWPGRHCHTVYARGAKPFKNKPFKNKAFRLFPALMLLLCTSLLVALETPSKPFLEKNSFYLSSAGFRVQLANDPAGQKAMRALPAHRFVMHKVGNDVRYFYAEPHHCVCIFVGTRQAYDTYRNILSQPLPQADA